MKLIIVSGRSGSGKSTALHILEDMGYYCIDNLPVGLLPDLLKQIAADSTHPLDKIAIGVDARNLASQLAQFPKYLLALENLDIKREILYLDAADTSLLQRFSETRRKHPLSSQDCSLAEAISKESLLLEPIALSADLTIDTTHLSIHQLRQFVQKRIKGVGEHGLSILFISFGFKKGVPTDADIVFDARCLPNPYWMQPLRQLTGQDKPVQDYLQRQPLVIQMLDQITQYLETWLPHFQANNRNYLTIAIGCTGGQHRSVYMIEMLAKHFSSLYDHVQTRHREIQSIPSMTVKSTS